MDGLIYRGGEGGKKGGGAIVSGAASTRDLTAWYMVASKESLYKCK